MDQQRFDRLARSVWQHPTRRRVLRQVAALPAVGVLATLLPDAEGAAAAHPGQRLQHRKDGQRHDARQRKKHRRNERRQGLGAGNANCTANLRRGQVCEDTCECQGAYRCGNPRLEDELLECGHAVRGSGDQVCCLGQGDSCTNSNDCECCGTLTCHLGRCRVRDGTTCAQGKIHRLKQCIGNGICVTYLPDPDACGPAQCGAEFGGDARTACEATVEGGRVCVGMPSAELAELILPKRCTQSADCPANQACVQFVFEGNLHLGCFPVCSS